MSERKIKLEDVIHFYIGCEVQTPTGIETLVLVGIIGSTKQKWRTVGDFQSFTKDWHPDNKLCLRKLEDIQEHEVTNLVRNKHGNLFCKIKLVQANNSGFRFSFEYQSSRRVRERVWTVDDLDVNSLTTDPLGQKPDREKKKLLKAFMQEFFPYSEFKKIGFFTKEMRGDYEAQAKRVCEFFGFKTVYEYRAEETRCHISYIDPVGKPFITVLPSIYE